MEIEIKMAGSGAIENGKAPKETIADVCELLNGNPKEEFITISTDRGPFLINKHNILTIKKAR